MSETFQVYLTMYLLYKREFLNFYLKSILFQGFTNTQTKTIFRQCNTGYNTGVAVQDNEAQQWWYSTILGANIISNTGKFPKMLHSDIFGENGGRSSYHSDLENQ